MRDFLSANLIFFVTSWKALFYPSLVIVYRIEYQTVLIFCILKFWNYNLSGNNRGVKRKTVYSEKFEVFCSMNECHFWKFFWRIRAVITECG
jgi:hypothetical protein